MARVTLYLLLSVLCSLTVLGSCGRLPPTELIDLPPVIRTLETSHDAVTQMPEYSVGLSSLSPGASSASASSVGVSSSSPLSSPALSSSSALSSSAAVSSSTEANVSPAALSPAASSPAASSPAASSPAASSPAASSPAASLPAASSPAYSSPAASSPAASSPAASSPAASLSSEVSASTESSLSTQPISSSKSYSSPSSLSSQSALSSESYSSTEPSPSPEPSPVPPSPSPVPPAPTPAPGPPEQGMWTYSNDTKVTCIVVQFAAQLNVTYPITINNTNSLGHLILNVPANASVVAGSCDAAQQWLQISWNLSLSNASLPNNLTLAFYKNETTKNYELKTLNVSLSPDLFANYSSNATVELSHGADWETPLMTSYRCSTPTKLTMTAESASVVATMTVSKLQEEAFRSSSGHEFSAARDCGGGDVPDAVPIAVGCALGGMVVVVLVAYLVARRRSAARGYLSM